MEISEIIRTCPENEIYNELLELDDKSILELGCGAAEKTIQIAREGHGRQIIAMEVDEIQHNKNLSMNLSNVTFQLAGAEAIPMLNDTFDVVFMFKSLHHIPVKLMAKALIEIHRVLKPNGIAYISEPLFAGDFNEILRLFHDEEIVRQKALSAINNAINTGIFISATETYFNSPLIFENFEDFENRILKVTHTKHKLSDSIYQQIQNLFSKSNQFMIPIRVNLLRAA
jgi:SAM-dependent methyltransferase